MQKNLIINSTILLVIASTLEMTLHEFGHFFASILVHAQHISIHHNYTANSNEGLSLISILFIKGAGPIISLLIGSIFHLICYRQTRRNILFLFNLYMSLFGYIGFFGYLIIAPMVAAGDTGYIFYALGFPLWIIIVLALFGAAILYFLINILMKYFIEMGSRKIIENAERKEFVRSLILFPLILGLVITTLLNLPVPVFISLIAPVCSPLTLLCGYENALEKNYSLEKANKMFEAFDKPHIWLYFFFILTIIINRLLVTGIYVN